MPLSDLLVTRRRIIRCNRVNPELQIPSLIIYPTITPMLQGSRIESSDLEDFFWYALSCSLVHHPRVCPTLLLWRRIIRLLWCVYPTWLIRIIQLYWVLQNSSNLAFLWVLSSCFALLGLFTSFLGLDEIHLTNTLVPLIALSPDHQNHSKWLKWGHVHYRCAC